VIRVVPRATGQENEWSALMRTELVIDERARAGRELLGRRRLARERGRDNEPEHGHDRPGTAEGAKHVGFSVEMTEDIALSHSGYRLGSRDSSPEYPMSKQEDAKIAKLAKKAAAKVAKPKDRSTQYDDTLKIVPREQDSDAKQLFKEMRKREF